MKKGKTIYQLLNQIKFSIILIGIILPIFFMIITSNLWFIMEVCISIFLLGFFNEMSIDDPSTFEKILSSNYILKYNFEYTIEQYTLYRNTIEIILDDEIIDKYDKRTVEEIVKLIEKSKNVSLKICDLNYDLIEWKISKERLLDFLKTKKSSMRFKDITFEMPIPINKIMIRNSFLPKHVLVFANMDNDEALIERIQNLSKKDLLNIILSRDSSEIKKINKLFLDTDSIFLDEIYTSENYNWKVFDFVHLNISDIKTSNESNSIELINCNFKNSLINQEIIQLIKDIDANISNGFTFSTIEIDKWNNYYKTEIVSKLNSNYELDKEHAERMIQILQKLKESMIDKNKEKDFLEKDTSITAMEEMLKLDGIDEIKLPSINK